MSKAFGEVHIDWWEDEPFPDDVFSRLRQAAIEKCGESPNFMPLAVPDGFEGITIGPFRIVKQFMEFECRTRIQVRNFLDAKVKITKDSRMVHKAVANTAKEMAGAYYERRASQSNSWFAVWPSQEVFIRRNWKNFVVYARMTLAKMLANNAYDETAKAQIYDILVQDATLPYDPRKDVQVVNVH